MTENIFKELEGKDFIFRPRKINLAIYIISTVFSSSFAFIILDEDGATGTFFLFLLCSSIGLSLIISSLTYTPSFGKTKSFTFGDITRAERGTVFWSRFSEEYIKAYREKEKLFYITETFTDFDVLTSILEKEGVHIENI